MGNTDVLTHLPTAEGFLLQPVVRRGVALLEARGLNPRGARRVNVGASGFSSSGDGNQPRPDVPAVYIRHSTSHPTL